MDYSGVPLDLLIMADSGIGDRVSVNSSGITREGMVMPRHMFTGDDILVLKLDSGYNVGVRLKEADEIKLISRKAKEEEPVKEMDANGPSISFISTGGTIASYVDYKTGAVHPAKSAEDLVLSVPELSRLCTPRVRVIASILSENMNVELWKRLAEAIVDEFNAGAKGVVVPHGTDTLGYTAAALSFMLEELPGPVVLVGSQRSSDRPSSDAAMNLLAATRVALRSFGEVVVVMHETSSDDRCAIHHGTRVRKFHTSRRDAFHSVNADPLGFVDGEKVVLDGCRAPSQKARSDTRMEMNVVPIYAYPGITPYELKRMGEGTKGLVILGTGLGHISSAVSYTIEDLIAQNVVITMASQCFWGRTNLNVYSSGRELLEAGVVEAGDMLPETALIKLMWALGHADTPEEAKKLFLENQAGEMSSRSPTEGGVSF